MSRDGSGTYSLPANTLAVSGDPISSTKFNSLVQDLESDANVDRPIAAGGTGASTASAARTNLGLAIGTDVQAFDAGLLSIAGLTTLADRSIYTTASDTYAVYTLTAAGRAILDDADATAQRTTLGLGNLSTVTASAFALTILDDADAAAVRTTIGAGTGNGDMLKSENLSGLANYTTARSNLGLGTAATVNTGTSGATIPLLNAANTFSAQQTVSDGSSRARLNLNGDVETWRTGGLAGYVYFNSAYTRYIGFDSTNYVAGGNTLWHAGNDGAGSGLDADTLDGVQGSAYAALSGATFVGAVSLSYATPVLAIVGSSSNIVSLQLHNATRYDDIRNTTAGLEFRVDTSGTPKSMLFNTAGGLQVRIAASTETTGTLTVASANETIQATGDITIPNAVFSAGDIILIYAGASSRTITQGASVTMRLGGTATTGSRTLAARGVAMLFFVSSSEVVVSGGAVT